MQKTLLHLAETGRLNRFLDTLLQQRGEEVAFVILFGSRARGDWLPGSDYDILIGLCGEDGKRLIDRIAEFSFPDMPDVEVLAYSRLEWQRMVREFHPLLLEALAHGVILWDRGEFATLQKTFQQWRKEDFVQPWRSGWKIAAREGEAQTQSL